MKKRTIHEITQHLIKNKESIEKRHRQILDEIMPRENRHRRCRNRGTNAAYCVPGVAAWTRAVKASGLPWNHYWSGFLPTPSTQYWVATYEEIKRFTQTDG